MTSVLYQITHVTRYSGEHRVSVGHNESWLQPRSTPRQQLVDFDFRIDPEPSSRTERIDYFGNVLHAFAFYEGYQQLVVAARSGVRVTTGPVLVPDQSPPWEHVRDGIAERIDDAGLRIREFASESPRARITPPVADYARHSFPPGCPVLVGLKDLNQRIYRDFRYDPAATTVATPVEEVFEMRRGVCQDFAHLMIACLRSLRLPARYVSGYLRTIPPPGRPRLVGADASHAWIGTYVGELGWIDADPTNNIFPNMDHVTLAYGRDYGDVPPLRGVFVGGGQHVLSVSVDVLPVPDGRHQSPRPASAGTPVSEEK